ncbi:hypothetical protein [Mucilaginibacter sp. HD30]
MDKLNNEDKPVIFNTPAGFNFQNLFEEHSIKFKPKVEFLIHQINYYDNRGGYQIHSKNHQWFFGIKGTELAMMLRKLVANGIIKLAANYHPGNTSNTYKMVTPFDIKAADTQQSFYYAHEVTFVKKWILDGHIVKNASTSSFIKERKATTNSAIIAAQQKQIDELRAQVLSFVNQSITGKDKQSTIRISNVEIVNDNPQATTISETDTKVDESPLDQNLMLDASGAMEEILPLSFDTVTPVDVVEDEPDISQLATLLSQNTMPNVEEKAFKGNLTIHYLEQGLGVGIEHGDTWGVLYNYDEMQPWCEALSEFEKQRLYHHIITSTEKDIKFPLNKHTKALFTRELMNGGLLFSYRGVYTA